MFFLFPSFLLNSSIFSFNSLIYFSFPITILFCFLIRRMFFIIYPFISKNLLFVFELIPPVSCSSIPNSTHFRWFYSTLQCSYPCWGTVSLLSVLLSFQDTFHLFTTVPLYLWILLSSSVYAPHSTAFILCLSCECSLFSVLPARCCYFSNSYQLIFSLVPG